MAQVEIEKREKRQREGIEQKKARGEWDDYGRPRVMDLSSSSGIVSHAADINTNN